MCNANMRLLDNEMFATNIPIHYGNDGCYEQTVYVCMLMLLQRTEFTIPCYIGKCYRITLVKYSSLTVHFTEHMSKFVIIFVNAAFSYGSMITII